MAKHRPINRYLILLLLSLLFGCSQTASYWHSRNISGLMPELAFHLTDDSGQAVTASRYKGKLTLLYFGFTHCEDACPTTLTTLGLALKRLDANTKRIRILFVSVDPQRDSPAVLHRYVAHFAPQVVGLTGTSDELSTLARRYRVSFSSGKPDSDGNYEVSHSSAIFVFDGSGKIRLLMSAQEGAAAIAEDLKRLLES